MERTAECKNSTAILEVAKFRDILKSSSSKLAREISSCTHSAQILADLDKATTCIRKCDADRKKLAACMEFLKVSEAQLQKLETATPIWARSRINYTGILANSGDKESQTLFADIAKTEIEFIHSHLESATDKIEDATGGVFEKLHVDP